jgi:hypothetical protein
MLLVVALPAVRGKREVAFKEADLMSCGRQGGVQAIRLPHRPRCANGLPVNDDGMRRTSYLSGRDGCVHDKEDKADYELLSEF